MLNYPLFIIPAACFVICYPLKVLLSNKEYKKIWNTEDKDFLFEPVSQLPNVEHSPQRFAPYETETKKQEPSFITENERIKDVQTNSIPSTKVFPSLHWGLTSIPRW